MSQDNDAAGEQDSKRRNTQEGNNERKRPGSGQQHTRREECSVGETSQRYVLQRREAIGQYGGWSEASWAAGDNGEQHRSQWEEGSEKGAEGADTADQARGGPPEAQFRKRYLDEGGDDGRDEGKERGQGSRMFTPSKDPAKNTSCLGLSGRVMKGIWHSNRRVAARNRGGGTLRDGLSRGQILESGSAWGGHAGRQVRMVGMRKGQDSVGAGIGGW
jgi:hypothetical protein